MRLIRTKSPIQLEEYQDNEVAKLKYAILSHRWEADEVSFQEMLQPTGATKDKKGYKKIEEFCKRARGDGFEYAWVDTCCINKESSAELSESLNSMFRWYLEAGKCYAFMTDVCIQNVDLFTESVWFSRGWTLQELIAPREIVFLANDWSEIGSREHLASRISQTTHIDEALLLGEKSKDEFCVSKRMSWAANRETCRAEDRAYSLRGIFNVSMPLLYGEGNNAFIRLQEEIMKDSSDETLFAWAKEGVSEESPCGLLAPSPDCFAESSDIMPYVLSQGGLPFALTNRGIRMQSPLIPPSSSITTLILQCVADSALVGIGIKHNSNSANTDDFVRITSHPLRGIPPNFLETATLDMTYIAKSLVVAPTNKPGPQHQDEDAGSETRSNPRIPDRLFHRTIKPRGQFKRLILLIDDTETPYRTSGFDNSARTRAPRPSFLNLRHIRTFYRAEIEARYGIGKASNLNMLDHLLHREDGSQVTFYRSWTHGMPFSRILTDAYEFLTNNHNPGDEISLFGFSRGCHVVATLCDILEHIGVAINGFPAGIYQFWSNFLSNKHYEAAYEREKMIKTRQSRDPGRIGFIGLFDAVQIPPQFAGMTTSRRKLWGCVVRHAISIDENRIHLRPTRIEHHEDQSQSLQQIWFPGTHQDLGGTTNGVYGDLLMTYSIGDLPLFWIATEARKAGLQIQLHPELGFRHGGNMPSLDIDLRNKEYRSSQSQVYETELARYLNMVQRDCLHSELEFGHGWSPAHVCKARIKNLFYSKTFSQSMAANCGLREIPAGSAVHAAVLRRMKDASDDHLAYRPPNLPIEDPDSLIILNEADRMQGYFIWKPTSNKDYC